MDTWTGFLFGDVYFEYGGHSLKEENIHSSKVLSLLCYLLIYHNRKIASGELNDMLWEEDEIANPSNALKNLMYRLRSLLKEHFGRNDFIITGENSYYWNSDIEVKLDIEQLEQLDQDLSRQQEYNKKNLVKMVQTLHIYKGKFLPNLVDKSWVMSLATYYHSMYLSNAKRLAEHFSSRGDNETTIKLCKEALLQDPLDDEIHYLFILSLMRSNHYDLALEQYHKASKLLYEYLEIRQSKYLQKIYMQLMKDSNQVNEDLSTIQTTIKDENLEDAFFCEFGVFKEIYHLELRRMKREGFSEFIILLTLVPKSYVDITSKEGLHLLAQEMESIKTILCVHLRSGDVISKYSGSQFIFMLHSCNNENAKRVIERVLSKYYAQQKHVMMEVEYTYDELQQYENPNLH